MANGDNWGRIQCEGDIFTDDEPPQVAITYPSDGDMFDVGASFALTATASDNKQITELDLLLNGASTVKRSEEPWSWPVGNIPAGVHTFEVVARDGFNETTSQAVTVTVTDGGGTVGTTGGGTSSGGTATDGSSGTDGGVTDSGGSASSAGDPAGTEPAPTDSGALPPGSGPGGEGPGCQCGVNTWSNPWPTLLGLGLVFGWRLRRCRHQMTPHHRPGPIR